MFTEAHKHLVQLTAKARAGADMSTKSALFLISKEKLELLAFTGMQKALKASVVPDKLDTYYQLGSLLRLKIRYKKNLLGNIIQCQEKVILPIIGGVLYKASVQNNIK